MKHLRVNKTIFILLLLCIVTSLYNPNLVTSQVARVSAAVRSGDQVPVDVEVESADSAQKRTRDSDFIFVKEKDDDPAARKQAEQLGKEMYGEWMRQKAHGNEGNPEFRTSYLDSLREARDEAVKTFLEGGELEHAIFADLINKAIETHHQQNQYDFISTIEPVGMSKEDIEKCAEGGYTDDPVKGPLCWYYLSQFPSQNTLVGVRARSIEESDRRAADAAWEENRLTEDASGYLPEGERKPTTVGTKAVSQFTVTKPGTDKARLNPYYESIPLQFKVSIDERGEEENPNQLFDNAAIQQLIGTNGIFNLTDALGALQSVASAVGIDLPFNLNQVQSIVNTIQSGNLSIDDALRLVSNVAGVNLPTNQLNQVRAVVAGIEGGYISPEQALSQLNGIVSSVGGSFGGSGGSSYGSSGGSYLDALLQEGTSGSNNRSNNYSNSGGSPYLESLGTNAIGVSSVLQIQTALVAEEGYQDLYRDVQTEIDAIERENNANASLNSGCYSVAFPQELSEYRSQAAVEAAVAAVNVAYLEGLVDDMGNYDITINDRQAAYTAFQSKYNGGDFHTAADVISEEYRIADINAAILDFDAAMSDEITRCTGGGESVSASDPSDNTIASETPDISGVFTEAGVAGFTPLYEAYNDAEEEWVNDSIQTFFYYTAENQAETKSQTIQYAVDEYPSNALSRLSCSIYFDEMQRDTDGQPNESAYILFRDPTTGALQMLNVTVDGAPSHVRSDRKREKEVTAGGGEAYHIHTHPDSGSPSAADLNNLCNMPKYFGMNGIPGVVVNPSDPGTVWKYSFHDQTRCQEYYDGFNRQSKSPGWDIPIKLAERLDAAESFVSNLDSPEINELRVQLNNKEEAYEFLQKNYRDALAKGTDPNDHDMQVKKYQIDQFGSEIMELRRSMESLGVFGPDINALGKKEINKLTNQLTLDILALQQQYEAGIAAGKSASELAELKMFIDDYEFYRDQLRNVQQSPTRANALEAEQNILNRIGVSLEKTTPQEFCDESEAEFHSKDR